eukprot:GHVU01164223.1.p1 GENE.GHVU01164223.1~~GHVU01164223.1.p1  ORF type:complete len:325 (+),score=10.52 GHVU01164223.1:123-1097(+)
MPRPRSELICIDDTPYYHVVSRCVRRAFLCGKDNQGKDFEHRRLWIEQRIRILSSIFGIQICSYAVMSNHLHIVVKLCPDEITALSDTQIVERWTSIYKGPSMLLSWIKEGSQEPVKQDIIDKWINERREKLSSLSTFMKCLNEPLARMANKEDNCTGHFWESRFKSQALLTEEALLSCMTYTDLNPIRAKMAETPETSDHTSIKERIKPSFDLGKAIKEQKEQGYLLHFNTRLKPLAKMEGNIKEEVQNGVLFAHNDYLELVDYTGRIINPKKRGSISDKTPPILERLGIDLTEWAENTQEFEKRYRSRFSHQRERQSFEEAA